MNDTKIRESLLRNSKEVFATMLGVKISELIDGQQARKEKNSERVVSLIGFAGDHTGNCMVSCSKRFACELAGLMLMEDHAEVNGEVMDALGEISNMIFGNVKSDLEYDLGPMQLSLPSVILGRDLNVRSLASPSWIVMPLSTGEEDFEACMCVSAQPAKRSQAGI